MLIQEDADPRHYVSFGSWSDYGHIEAWRASPEFAENLGRCRELCDEFRGTDFTVAALS
jgi:hypothetical protein